MYDGDLERAKTSAQPHEHLRGEQHESPEHDEGAQRRKSFPARQEQRRTYRHREDGDGEPPELSGKRGHGLYLSATEDGSGDRRQGRGQSD